MRLSTPAALAVSAAALLLLSGCAPTPSWVTITYELDGAEHSVTMHPDSVTCDESSAYGGSMLESPVGIFSFLLPGTSQSGSITAGIGPDGEPGPSVNVAFEADDSSPVISDSGVVTLPETKGTAVLYEDVDSERAEALVESDGTRVNGTISAEVHCDAE